MPLKTIHLLLWPTYEERTEIAGVFSTREAVEAAIKLRPDVAFDVIEIEVDSTAEFYTPGHEVGPTYRVTLFLNNDDGTTRIDDPRPFMSYRHPERCVVSETIPDYRYDFISPISYDLAAEAAAKYVAERNAGKAAV